MGRRGSKRPARPRGLEEPSHLEGVVLRWRISGKPRRVGPGSSPPSREGLPGPGLVPFQACCPGRSELKGGSGSSLRLFESVVLGPDSLGSDPSMP